ncbi:MAG: hypothetical protein E7028_06345 [Planctomycetaceae bacterium]|nr:hypothetical protein [Planctomycetaceae bacterium]MBQ2821692.1 NIPSNAP family protein [Thermoguttaceae bacterium]
MKRREFLTAGAAAAVGGVLAGENILQAEECAAVPRELIDVRILFTDSAEKRDKLLSRCDELLIPLCRKIGLGKTGIFSVNLALHEGDQGFDSRYENAVFFMTSASCFGKLEAFHEALHTISDPAKRIQTFKDDALYSEMEATLMRAFPHCPKLEVPNLSPDRVVQFRRYFSPSCDRNRAKRNMFDIRGELNLFKQCGMMPVFFGEMLYGTVMPNMSYALSFENDQIRRESWKKFVTSPEWKQMSGEAAFKDTATKIRNLFLKPTPSSEI